MRTISTPIHRGEQATPLDRLEELGLLERGGGGPRLSPQGRRMLDLLLSYDDPKPEFDGETGELRWRGVVVKRLVRKAKNQRAVLRTFEEEGWPARIDDPASDRSQDRPLGEQIQDTVRSLNERLPADTIRFHGDGDGIRWEAVGQRRTFTIGTTL